MPRVKRVMLAISALSDRALRIQLSGKHVAGTQDSLMTSEGGNNNPCKTGPLGASRHRNH